MKRLLLLLPWLVCGVLASGPIHSPRDFNEARARVVIVEDPDAVTVFRPRPQRVEEMFTRGLLTLTGKDDTRSAWLSLVSPEDVIGIKVTSTPGGTSGTRPSVVAAAVQGLLSAGVPPANIIIWDRQSASLRRAGYFELAERFGVGIAASAEAGFDDAHFYETALIGQLVWGDHEFGKRGGEVGRRSFVSRLLTERLTKIIQITPLLNHSLAGVSGNLFGLSRDSVDNTIRFESSSHHLGVAIPEIYALPVLGDRVVLNVVDALICQYQGADWGLLHYSVMLGQLRFSTDPVALDILSLEELERQRKRAGMPLARVNMQIYTNASLLEIGVSDRRKIDVEQVR
jgi:hypothetical protein